MTYDASSEIIDLGTASEETKGPPGLPFPDALGAFAQQGLSND
ncbi:benenodin family lasso peptide [Sphingosinicella microcystinivorans]|nr:benenodin family lasso peptide [Sphingosinicella microcystinivorans]WBX83745.1 benenodin family lasso peptide [Sphingosinicella microcystinivorans]